MLWLEIPAYAGSTSPAPAGQGPAPDHPRIRGEHRSTAGTTASRRGSSPHTRGALGILLAIFIQLGIIPAYAGSTQAPARIPHLVQDHPRIRGEHVPAVLPCCCGAGSSPHTRGARRRRRTTGISQRIIPAYAGSTPACPSPSGAGRDHPRIRGEHGMRGAAAGAAAGSSPHTRGAHVGDAGMIAIVGIIPAYAGSTHLVLAPLVAGPGSSPHTRGAPDGRNTTSSPTPDHPRIRGEHDASGIQGPFDAGSSPHTRGAH